MPGILDQIVSERLGPAPGAAPAAQAGAQPAQAQQPQQPQQAQAPAKAPSDPTQGERAAAKVAPKAPGSQPPVELIEIGEGDSRLQLTPEQIQGTFNRYRDLNHRWQSEVSPMMPVLKVVKSMMDAAKSNGHEPKAEEVAQLVESAVKAFVSNPQMGRGAPSGAAQLANDKDGDEKGKGGQDDGDGDEVLSRWEKENAVKLPPGYKEQMQMGKQLQAQVAQILELLTRGQGPAAAAAQAVGQAQQMAQTAQASTMQAARQSVMNNIQAAMQAASLKPEDIPDFQAFAMARGYTPADFIDPELTRTVVSDFSANRQAPEISRLREVMSRRQAFTGSPGSTPGGAAAAAPAAPGNSMLDSLITAGLRARNMA